MKLLTRAGSFSVSIAGGSQEGCERIVVREWIRGRGDGWDGDVSMGLERLPFTPAGPVDRCPEGFGSHRGPAPSLREDHDADRPCRGSRGRRSSDPVGFSEGHWGPSAVQAPARGALVHLTPWGDYPEKWGHLEHLSLPIREPGKGFPVFCRGNPL